MPVYEYLCAACGPFTSMRAMADYEKPSDCPDCGTPAPRVLLTAPSLWTMADDRRLAHATNERSADAPRVLSKMHGAGCACCSGQAKKRARKTTKTKDGAKSFPTSRPWMISH